MKNSAPLTTIIVLGILVAISACAIKPAAPAPIATVSSRIIVATSIPVESGPISQISPAPVTGNSVEPSAGGQKIIALADKGKTIGLALGESFLLKLGEAYTWEISLSNQSVIGRVKDIAVTREFQGVYEALKTGTVTLAASGDPLCRQSKHPCGMPTILFEITIVVK